MPTPSMLQLLQRSREFDVALQAEFPSGPLVLASSRQRDELAAAAALIAIEHASALRAAAHTAAMNSASALLRLQYEAVLRAAWILYAAPSGQVDKLGMPLDPEAELGAKNTSGLSDMLAAVEKSAPAALATALVEFNRHSRHALNSFVHTGIHPLARTRAGFPPELAETVVRHSAGVSHFAYRLLAALSGSPERMSRVTRVYVDFTDCLPMAPAAEEPLAP